MNSIACFGFCRPSVGWVPMIVGLMYREHLASFIPISHLTIAEATSGSEIGGFNFPVIDQGKRVKMVEMTKMLNEMVFPSKALLAITCPVVVG